MPGGRQRGAGLRADADKLGQVVSGRDRCGSLNRRRSRDRCGSLGRRLFGDFRFVVRYDLGAAELLHRRVDERLQRGCLRGRQRARDQEGLVDREGLLDHPDRCAPVPFIQDEQGALSLVELLRDLPHELVVDPDVVHAVAQPVQDASRRAADDRTGRPEDDGADDDTEARTTDRALGAAEIRGLMDLDPEPGPVGDGGIDDLDVGVDVVDLLEALQESPRLLARVQHEGGKGLTVLVAHYPVSFSCLRASQCWLSEVGRIAHRTPPIGPPSARIHRAVGGRSRRDQRGRGARAPIDST